MLKVYLRQEMPMQATSLEEVVLLSAISSRTLISTGEKDVIVISALLP